MISSTPTPAERFAWFSLEQLKHEDMKDFMLMPTDKPIVLPEVGTEYFYIQSSLSKERYRVQRCTWQGFLTDRLRYITNFYTTEDEAQKVVDKMNALLNCMVQPGRKLNMTHPSIKP